MTSDRAFSGILTCLISLMDLAGTADAEMIADAASRLGAYTFSHPVQYSLVIERLNHLIVELDTQQIRPKEPDVAKLLFTVSTLTDSVIQLQQEYRTMLKRVDKLVTEVSHYDYRISSLENSDNTPDKE